MEATVLREAIARQTVQDRLIIERNAEGVRSLAYVRGAYSATLESGPIGLVSRYLRELSVRCDRAVN
jgi:hypothetical protein